MHSEGILAGELKHGPLALIDDAMPVIMVVTKDPVYSKCMNAIQQVTARGGRPVIICEKGDDETQKFAHKFLEVPHTVDCLQVEARRWGQLGYRLLIMVDPSGGSPSLGEKEFHAPEVP
ncbi:glutamine--fructose-6-phosphate aminotransferase 2 [Trichonephila clavipes]|nr:glutamine--fructose-6-phosphate aminotransferase 2 [Trichonephila clavipes]